MRVGLTGLLLVLLLNLTGCGGTEDVPETLFILRDSKYTGVDFENRLEYTEELNTYTFKNFYNGGGVGLGDFDNDGLVDIFFSGNLVSNKLYKNKGIFTFEDITKSSGLESDGVWTTGVSIVDINADGFLDIYICKSGPPTKFRRSNELFINNGNLTFSEESEKYGLAFDGLSVHAAFFDFDRDGDLDCYLLNNSLRSVGGYDLRKDQRLIPDSLGGNKLLRNDQGRFVDVSQKAGIYTSAIGFGLGVTIGDVNKDGWGDIYVSNDFFEKDYLYINNHDGTFTESLEEQMNEISLGSMGADMADINNDGWPEIFVTEMLPESDERLKTTSQFENWDKYRRNLEMGYFHQFSRNVLQLNNGDGSFSEVGRMAGVHATDWSWGALIFDMDNDGLKDLFVANGIYKDLLDQDYVNFGSNPAILQRILRKEKNMITTLIDSIPSNKVANYAFKNNGNLSFTNKALDWGLGVPTFSNGSAYGDLDNDGDLDLVLNNVNMPAFIYENRSRQLKPQDAFISFSLEGNNGNSKAIGAKVTLKIKRRQYYQELSPMRGFMSTVDNQLHFGLGDAILVDTVIVNWNSGRHTILTNVNVNQKVLVNEADSQADDDVPSNMSVSNPIFRKGEASLSIDFKHQENDFSDFDRDRLLFNMISNEGPCLCTADINNDGRYDFYIGGAKGQSGGLFVQSSSGGFVKAKSEVLDLDKASEDTDCIFFDSNNDGRVDLYVSSGGSEFSSNSTALLDRLYINNGNLNFEKSSLLLPSSSSFQSTSTVTASDFDGDGDLDLFVGARLVPSQYGVPGNGYILRNMGNGLFEDATKSIAPELVDLGLITGAQWADVNNDSKPDLIIVGEWMPIRIFINENFKLLDRTREYGLERTNGWYNCIETADFDNDGLVDFAVGNHGLNSRFKASESKPISMYINDFDQNGSIDQILTYYNRDVSFPLVLRQDLVSQIPTLKKRFLHYKQYKGKVMSDIFSDTQLQQSLVLNSFTFETSIWINQKTGTFKKGSLPIEVQYAPTYAILVDDFDNDDKKDLVLGGNLLRAKPETGIYNGSYGLMLKGDGYGNFIALDSRKSGIHIQGEIRSIKSMPYQGRHIMLVGKNNGTPEVFKF